jgi:hypothetical protein
VLHVQLLQGLQEGFDGARKKVFSISEEMYPYPLTLAKLPKPDSRFIESGPLSAAELFPPNQEIIFVGEGSKIPFGSKGKALDLASNNNGSSTQKTIF